MNRFCSYLSIVLLAGLGGCVNPLQGPNLQRLEAESQSLAANMHRDASAGGDIDRRPTPLPVAPEPIQLVAGSQSLNPKLPKVPKNAMTLPPGLPGNKAEPITRPKNKADLPKMLDKLYPPLPPLEEELVLAPGPEGRPMTLADMQRLALQYSPAIRAAEAGVVAARGILRQSLTYPNPVLTFEHDTNNTGPAGYPGFAYDQIIKTGNKLQLQGAAATMDLLNAQLALKKARNDVASQIRGGYFSLLVAYENVKVSMAFARFTEEIYAMQVNLVRGDENAPYEPMQLRPLALQARYNLTLAVNQYLSSWRQMVAALGLPDMPPSEIAGRVDLPIPAFTYAEVLDRIQKQHTDVLTSENSIRKAEYLYKLAQVMPTPDVGLHVLVQKDYTTPPNYTVLSLGTSVVLPLWDKNRGNIQATEAQLVQARHNLAVTRNTLAVTLADAFNRYQSHKRLVTLTLAQITDQVRVYQAVYNRYRSGGDTTIAFGDVVTAQQTLANYITSYVAALGQQWTAVVDVANLLQTDDLFQGTKEQQDGDAPRLEQLESMFRCPQVSLRARDLPATDSVAAPAQSSSPHDEGRRAPVRPENFRALEAVVPIRAEETRSAPRNIEAETPRLEGPHFGRPILPGPNTE